MSSYPLITQQKLIEGGTAILQEFNKNHKAYPGIKFNKPSKTEMQEWNIPILSNRTKKQNNEKGNWRRCTVVHPGSSPGLIKALFHYINNYKRGTPDWKASFELT